MSFFASLSAQLTRYTAVVLCLAAVLAMLGPASFAWVKGDTKILVLGIIMMGMGMTLGK